MALADVAMQYFVPVVDDIDLYPRDHEFTLSDLCMISYGAMMLVWCMVHSYVILIKLG